MSMRSDVIYPREVTSLKNAPVYHANKLSHNN